MRDYTLVLDIDGTIVDSPPCVDYAEWEAMTRATHYPPIPRAIECIRELARRADAVVFLTARSERLRDATIGYLQLHLPSVPRNTISMRAESDEGTPPILSKWARLHNLHLGPSLIVDDDPGMRVCARAGDGFWLAPGCWK